MIESSVIRVDPKDLLPPFATGILESSIDVAECEINLGDKIIVNNPSVGVPTTCMITSVRGQLA